MLTIHKQNHMPRGSSEGRAFSEGLMEAVMHLQKEVLRFHARFDFGELSRLHLGALGILRREGPLPVSELAARLYTSRPQMTALVDRLVERGLVERGADPADRRVTTVALTAGGREVLQKGVATAHPEVSQRLAGLTDGEREELASAVATLQRILAKL
jgi:DNA-binding MarR family transcriptional regulator